MKKLTVTPDFEQVSKQSFTNDKQFSHDWLLVYHLQSSDIHPIDYLKQFNLILDRDFIISESNAIVPLSEKSALAILKLCNIKPSSESMYDINDTKYDIKYFIDVWVRKIVWIFGNKVDLRFKPVTHGVTGIYTRQIVFETKFRDNDYASNKLTDALNTLESQLKANGLRREFEYDVEYNTYFKNNAHYCCIKVFAKDPARNKTNALNLFSYLCIDSCNSQDNMIAEWLDWFELPKHHGNKYTPPMHKYLREINNKLNAIIKYGLREIQNDANTKHIVCTPNGAKEALESLADGIKPAINSLNELYALSKSYANAIDLQSK